MIQKNITKISKPNINTVPKKHKIKTNTPKKTMYKTKNMNLYQHKHKYKIKIQNIHRAPDHIMIHYLCRLIVIYVLLFWHTSNLPRTDLDCGSPTINMAQNVLLNGLFGMYHTLGIQNGSERYNSKYYDTPYYQGMVSEYMLNDTYLAAFEISIKNGVPSCANIYLIKDVMKCLWGYNGYVTSDSRAIMYIYENHLHTASLPLAVATCDCADGSAYQEYMAGLVKNGTAEESTLDASIKRLFKLTFQLGLFDPVDDQPYWQIPPSIVNDDHAQKLIKFAAKQIIILLKNGNDVSDTSDDILPWDVNNVKSKIGVIGPHYNAAQYLLYSGYTPPASAVFYKN